MILLTCQPQQTRWWPDHRRLAAWAHHHGMHTIYHTDGNVQAVLDLYVEAGFDCLQPLEAKAGMDGRALVPAGGDRLACCGNIDVRALSTHQPDEVEEEVRAKLLAGMAGRGGYVYPSDHSVPPTVSWATYRHLVTCLDRHGGYESSSPGGACSAQGSERNAA